MSSQSNEHKLSRTRLERITERSSRDKSAIFTSIIHVVDLDLLNQCFDSLSHNKAVGLDKVTKAAYSLNLEENLKDLLVRIRKRTYIPKPAKITQIPKTDGTYRPLAISSLEDKIVQEALKRILEAIYEPLFLDVSNGFRPKRGCDTALKMLNGYLKNKSCGAIIDIDLKSFFNNIPHDKLLTLLEKKINQPDFFKLLIKTLKTPYLNQAGQSVPNLIGVPQGSIVSPILANIFLHYAIDAWFMKIKGEGTFGEINMVRYADDAIFIFEDMQKAEYFMSILKERLASFGIELNENKTKIIKGGYAEAKFCDKQQKPISSFTFLGFVHSWKQSFNKVGKGFWRPFVRSCPIRMRKKLKDVVAYIKKHRHDKDIVRKAAQVVTGIAGYFCVNDNQHAVKKFAKEVRAALFKWLNRRGQKGRMNWEKFFIKLNQARFPRGFQVKNLFYVYNANGYGH